MTIDSIVYANSSGDYATIPLKPNLAKRIERTKKAIDFYKKQCAEKRNHINRLVAKIDRQEQTMAKEYEQSFNNPWLSESERFEKLQTAANRVKQIRRDVVKSHQELIVTCEQHTEFIEALAKQKRLLSKLERE